MEFVYFFVGVIATVIFYQTARNLSWIASYKQMEIQFLFSALNLMQYKHHAIKIIEISYADQEEKSEECKQIVKKIHEKFDAFGEYWIQDLIKRLPYKTEYNDWKSATLYAEQLINNNKK